MPIDSAIKRHFKSENLDPEAHAWIAGRLEQWCQELFCDLFAVSLVGPLYAFATADFFRLISDQQTPRLYQFALTHPADALRFRAMYRHLKKLGWIEELPSNLSRLTVLEEYDSVEDHTFTFPQRNHNFTPVLKPFFDVHNNLLEIVERVTGPAIENPRGFNDWIDPIGDCLGEAIVPSAAVAKGNTELSKIVLLNAGYLFATTRIDELCAGRGPTTPVSHRSRALQRLELWVMKSLEDHELLTKAAKN